MSRTHLTILLAALALAAAGCSKPAANQDTGAVKGDMGGGGGKVAVPGGEAPKMVSGMGNPENAPGAAKGGTDDPFKLKPDEGQLSVESPKDVVAGTEVTAKILVTPSAAYKINKEFPTKLTLETPAGVTIAKAQLTAGGHDQAKGDAEAFDERQLAFLVKLTPASGSHTITGTFKFAVCDKDTCLAKKEQISIVVAAK
jgi:hypothetical protein